VLKHINKLDQKKIRNNLREFIIEGIKGVEEALNSNFIIKTLIIEGNKRDEAEFNKIIKIAQAKKILIEFYGRKQIEKIKTTETFPGVLAIVNQPEVFVEDLIESNNIICLDEVRDPGNLGTIIRTADWFGIRSIILSENCVELYNPKVVRSTMGSIFHVKIYKSNNLIDDLLQTQKKGYTLAGLTLSGEDISKINLKNKTIYILGSESHGIRPEIEKILDKRYTISGKGRAESLNVAVATGILCSRIQL